MTWKTSLMVVVFSLLQITRSVGAVDTAPPISAGDSIVLEVAGAPAISMLRLMGSKSYDAVNNGPRNFCIPLEATVIAVEQSGDVFVQYQTVPNLNDKDPRIVTVVARFGMDQIALPSPYGPSEPPQAQQPSDLERQVLKTRTRQANLPKVSIQNMEGVRMRAWKMVEVVE